MMISFLYDALYTMPLTISILSIFHVYVFYEEASKPEYILAIIFSLFFAGIKSMKPKWRAASFAAIIIGFIVFLFLLSSPENKEILATYSFIGYAILFALAGLIVALLAIRFKWIRYTISIGLIILMAMYMYYHNNVHSYDIAAFLLFIILVLSEILKKKDNDTTNMKLHILGISPFILAGFICILSFKILTVPYDWNFVAKIYGFFEEKYITLSQYLPIKSLDSFDTATAGYSDFGEFNAVLKNDKNSKLVMNFRPASGKKTVRYLQGSTFDSFDGKRWTHTFNDTENDMLIDAALMTYQAYMHTDSPSDYIKMTHADINFYDMKTLHIFAPEKTIKIAIKSKNNVTNSFKDSTPYFSETQGINTHYNVTYMNQYPLSDIEIELINNACEIDKDSYEIFNGYNICNKYLQEVSYKEILERRDFIYKQYTKDPEISDRAIRYVTSITKNASTDYEKIDALKEALKQIPYTFDTGAYPKNLHSEADFLDYFLFENPKGYCMHYATALTILARHLGLPARYVQGYYIPINSSKPTDVYESNAHAWVQVYFDNIGWITIDATPGYGLETVIFDDEESVSQNATVSGNNTSTVSGNALDTPMTPDDFLASNTDLSQSDVSDNIKNQKSFLIIITISICSMLVLLLLILLLEHIIIHKKYEKMGTQQKLLTLCKENIRILKSMHYTLKTGTTLEDILHQVKAEIPNANMDFIEIYERCLYSDYQATENDLNIVLNCHEDLLVQLKTNAGLFKYLLAKTTSCV